MIFFNFIKFQVFCFNFIFLFLFIFLIMNNINLFVRFSLKMNMLIKDISFNLLIYLSKLKYYIWNYFYDI